MGAVFLFVAKVGDLAGLSEKVLDYGIGAVVLFIVAKAVLVPVIRSMLRQFENSQKVIAEALELLRDSVQSNQKAVAHFAVFEEQEEQMHARLFETQNQIMQTLNTLLETQKQVLLLLQQMKSRNHQQR